MGMRVTVVSDSHLSDRNPVASRHWDGVVEHLAAEPPDLVVHAGDAALDAGSDPAELGVVRQAMQRVPVPWTIVPGDHDLDGDLEGSEAASLARFRAEVGPDRFSVAMGAWRVLGVNAMVMGAGSPSGHVHQYLQHESDGITHVWAPATWATLPDRIQPPVGAKVVGVLALTLHDDVRHEVELQHPAGRREATLGVDVDDPYARLHT
jgi:hypothetical protein